MRKQLGVGVTIRRREDALFDRWRIRSPDFIPDGAVDEECYLQSQPMILFLLKEISNPKPDGWDLREFLRTGGRAMMWDNVTRWVLGVRSLDSDLPWSELELIGRQRRVEVLRSIVAMNLKKSPGGGNADYKAIREAAVRDQVFLRRQYEFYDPDLVICCGGGVRSLFARFVAHGIRKRWWRTSEGVRYTTLAPGKYAIDFRHPQIRGRAEAVYHRLIAVLREIRSSA